MSERELSTWRAYLATGSERAAAVALGISVATVKRHISMLKAEYGARNLAELALMLRDSTAVR